MSKVSSDLEKLIFPISVVADILNVNQRTLKIYEKEKILCPERSPKKRRIYTYRDIKKGKFIQHLKRNLRVNFAGIKIIIHLLKQLNVSSDDYLKKINEIAL